MMHKALSKVNRIHVVMRFCLFILHFLQSLSTDSLGRTHGLYKPKPLARLVGKAGIVFRQSDAPVSE